MHRPAAPNGKSKASKPKMTNNAGTGRPKTPSDKMQAGGRIPATTAKLNVLGSTVRITFSGNVVVTGSLDLQPDGPFLLSTQVIDASEYLLTYAAPLVGVTYEGLAQGNAVVSPFNGGQFNGIRSGTFD